MTSPHLNPSGPPDHGSGLPEQALFPRREYCKVIFLDIDGVLSLPADGMPKRREGGRRFNSHCVEMLNSLSDIENCALVVSSTWRLGRSREQFIALLEAEGIIIPLHEDWCTPSFTERHRYDGSIRDREILHWITHHPEVTRWVAFDDLPLTMLPPEHFVQTHEGEGLSSEKAEAARKALSASHPNL